MSSTATEVRMPPRQSEIDRSDIKRSATIAAPGAAGLRVPALGLFALAMPSIVAALALALHLMVASRQKYSTPTHHYPLVLKALLGASPLLMILSWVWPAARAKARHVAPLMGGGIVLLCAWDLITLKFALLPLPFFPGPDAVFRSLADDWRRLLDCTFRSLLLLAAGYTLGACAGFICGVVVGWFPRMRYWLMPLLKLVGPIPATVWLPLSIMLFPGSFISGMVLIALAVWFPMTMLTSSGISNVRVSHLEVARTLGAGPAFLIFRVAIPSALPNIFIGMFMGLGAAFLTLIVAEGVGVKSGLGWYIDMGSVGAEYDMIFASVLVTAVFFSTLMTLLFKLRDRVLFWQKGVIKW